MGEGVEIAEGTSGRRRFWTAEEKRRIVEKTLSSTSASSSREAYSYFRSPWTVTSHQ